MLADGSAETAARLDAATFVANEPGEMLTDDLAIQAGKRVEFELIFTSLAAEHLWDESPILSVILARYFGLVVLQEPLDAPARPLISARLTENVHQALREAYAPAGQINGYWLYRPA